MSTLVLRRQIPFHLESNVNEPPELTKFTAPREEIKTLFGDSFPLKLSNRVSFLLFMSLVVTLLTKKQNSFLI